MIITIDLNRLVCSVSSEKLVTWEDYAQASDLLLRVFKKQILVVNPDQETENKFKQIINETFGKQT